MNRTGTRILNGLLLATSALVASPIIASTAALAAGPTGGSVAVGSATITNPSSSQTVVTQTSKKALINWNSFSVSSGSSVQFKQPNSTSLTVNRVTGANASTIDGQLLANGNIWLINANGILFGKGSQINVGALLATTSDISDDDFRNGKNKFNPSKNPNASVDNQGTITATRGGSVVLSAPHVSNEGVIQADLGTVVLGGAQAFTVDMTGDNLLRYQITAPVTQAPKDSKGNTQTALVSNSGTIAAAGGHVLMTARAAQNVEDNVINNSGMVEANSVSSHNGEIDLDAGPNGTVADSGTLDASGKAAGQTGGVVNVTAGTVNVADGAKIDASGSNGGGTIQIGGGFHGGGTLAHATRTIIGKATITADAISKGNGGNVAVWSDGNTSFAGSISAKGGAQGGNGGQIETSGGLLSVQPGARIDTSAHAGLSGSWLLDPTFLGSNVTIDTCAGTCDADELDAGTIQSTLNGGTRVTVEDTSGTSFGIDVNEGIDWNSAATLSLLSEGFINLNASLQNKGTGALNIIAGWDGTTGATATANGQSTTSVDVSQITQAHAYGAAGGDITFSNGVAVGSAQGATTLAGANITMTSSSGVEQIGYAATDNTPISGSINIFASDDLDLTANATVFIGNGNATSSNVLANVGGDISITVGGTTNFTEEGGAIKIGNAGANLPGGFANSGNVTFITGSLSEQVPILESNALADIEDGNVFVGFRSSDIDWNSVSPGVYDSPYNLTLASHDNTFIESSILNSGSGNVAAIGGWDSTNTNFANLAFTSSTYGGEGDVYIGTSSANGSVSVGSAGGETLAAGGSVHLYALNGFAQIGYNSGQAGTTTAATGDITVFAKTGEVDLGPEAEGDYAQIGHGGQNTSTSNSGNITVMAGDNITLQGSSGYAQIGHGGLDASGANYGGDIKVTVVNGDVILNGGNDPGGYAQIGNGGFQDARNAANSSGNITINAANVTLNSDIAYALVGDGGPNNDGTGSGAITVNATGNVALTADANVSFAQIGNEGFDGGDIAITAGNVTLNADVGGSSVAQIGNNVTDFDGEAAGSVGGDISLNVSGATSIDASENGNVYLGNLDPNVNGTAQEFGDVTVVTGSGDLTGAYLENDLGTGTTGGDVFVGFTNPGGDINVGDMEYDSTHNFTWATTGNLDVNDSVTNSGSGAINLIAGWDGTTTDVTKLKNAGVYGNGNGALTISVGEGGFIDVGSMSGTTTVEGYDVELSAFGGSAQIGYNGGGTGDITVQAAHDVDLNARNGYAQIGNGGEFSNSSNSGNITVNAGGIIDLDAENNYAQIGNGGAFSNSEVDDTNGGNITVNAASVTVQGGDGSNAYAQIGHGGEGSNDGTGGGNSGDISVTANTGNIQLLGGDSEGEGATDNYAQIGSGGASTGTTGDGGVGYTTDTGNITVTAKLGSVILTGSPDVSIQTGYAVIGETGTAIKTGNITVVAGKDILLTGGASTYGTGEGSGIGNSFAVIGDVDQGTITNNINVSAGGNLTIMGGTGDSGGAGDYAQIGNNGHTGDDVIGNITANVTGLTTIASSVGGDGAYLGNTGSDQTGNDGVANVTGDIVLNSAGGLNISATGANAIAMVGELGSTDYSESGNITVNTTTSALRLTSTDQTAYAQIGNWTDNNTSGTSSGNIVIKAGAVTLDASSNGFASSAEIGNGNFEGYTQTGLVSGNISVNATSIVLNATTVGTNGNNDARIGNLGGGNVTGNLNVTTTGDVTLIADATNGGGATADVGGYSSIFEVTDGFETFQGEAIGNVTIASGGNVSISATGTGGFGAIEMGGAQSGSVAVTSTGNISIVANSGAGVLIGGGITGNGGVNVNATSTGGGIEVSSVGANSTAQIGNNELIPTGQSSATYTLNGNVAVDAVVGNVTLASDGSGNSARIGNLGATDTSIPANTTIAGDVFITAGNTLGVGDPAETQIGNFAGAETGNLTVIAGTISGDISGDINNAITGGDVTVGLTTTTGTNGLGGFSYTSAHDLTLLSVGNLTIGNSVENAGAGNVTLVAGWDGTTLGDVAALETALAYGTAAADTIIIGGANANGNVAVGSAQGATTALTGSLLIDAENGYAQLGTHGATSGAINVVGTGAVTVTGKTAGSYVAQIGNGGTDVSGNSGGDITILTGGGMVSVDALGNNAIAEIGNMDQAGGTQAGNITINTNFVGDITLDSTGTGFAQIGHGATFGAATTGNVSLDGATISSSGSGRSDVTGNTLDITLPGTGGNVGSSTDPLSVAVNALAIDPAGGVSNAYINSLRAISLGVGATGIDLPGGVFSLTSAGAVTQTQAITAGTLDVSTTAGGITLTNTGNTFGTLNVSTTGTSNANIVDSGSVSVQSGGVGGNLTLSSAGNIAQTGAIAAAVLTARAAQGNITLTNAANAIGTAQLNALHDAALVDSANLAIISATVGGNLTLSSGGNITQTGAIAAAVLNASAAQGSITLTDAANIIGATRLAALNDAALDDSTNLIVTGATVGGDLALVSGGNITQSGAIAAGALNASAAQGSIVLTDGSNAIGAAQLTALHDTAIYDSTDLTVTGATLGGNLTVLGQGNVTFTGSAQSSSGAVLVAAGWDGSTAAGSIAASGAYGRNGDSVVIGGANAQGGVAVGSASGTTTVLGNNVTLNAANGYAQIGFNGDASGDIIVDTKNAVLLEGGSSEFDYAQIGHGGANSVGSNSGNITVKAGGAVDVEGGSGIFSYAQIGHGGDSSNGEQSASFSRTGDISITGASVLLDGGTGGEAYAQIGHGGAESGGDPTVAITETLSGNITVTATDGSVSLLAGAGNSYAQIGHGGAFDGLLFSGAIGVQPQTTASGNITVHAIDGSVILTADQSGSASDQSAYAQIGHGGSSSSDFDSGDILVEADDNVVLTGGNAQPSGFGLSYAQIGHGAGAGSSGNITIDAGGDLSLIGSAANSSDSDFVQIGNGSVLYLTQSSSPASGDISINVGGTTKIQSVKGGSDVWIGNIGNTESGDVSLTTADFDNTGDNNDDVGLFAASDLSGGNVSLNITDAASTTAFGALDYDSANTLSLKSAGDLEIIGDIQNAGAGNITVAATGDLTIGGSAATADASIGSAGGTTIVSGGNITLDAVNGNAQIGYSGAGGGAIDVSATNNILVETGNSERVAQIGNGGFGVSGDVGGDIGVTAGGNITLTAGASSSVANIGNMSGAGTSQSGNIIIDAGGALVLDATNASTNAQIGNLEVATSDQGNYGDASGNINVTAASLVLNANGTQSAAQIGNGNPLFYNDAVSGDVIVHTGDLTMSATGATGGNSLARIGDSADGNATSNVTIVASGAIDMTAGDDGYAVIGLNSKTGAVAGDVSVSAANVDMESTGLNGQTFIGNDADAGNASGDLTVTAAGTITLDAKGQGSGATISSFGAGTIAGNVTVTATDGDVLLTASGNGAGAGIGLGTRGSAATADGTVLVTAGGSSSGTGSIELNATGTNSGADIGNGLDGSDTSITGNVTLVASNDVDVNATGSGAFAVLGSDGLQNVTGMVDVTAGGTISVNGASALIGNLAKTAGTASGDVTVTAAQINGIGNSIANDLPGGDFALDQTGTGLLTLDPSAAYTSAHDLSVSAAGDIVVAGIVQNAGTGNITLASGGDLTVGGTGATGAASVGSAGGTTNVTADNITLNAVNGDAQIGYNGAGSGAVNVSATGNILVESGGSGTIAQIGNGGAQVVGDVSGDVSVTTSGGTVDIDSSGSGSAMIGDLTGGGASTEGSDITVDTNGGAIELVSNGSFSHSQIGNWALNSQTGPISGNIDVNLGAGALTLVADGADASAQIGNGNYLGSSSTGAISGNITVNAATLTMNGTAPASGNFEEVRIGNLGAGAVSGDLQVTTTGDISLAQTGAGATSIGNFSNPRDANGNEIQGEDTGNVTVRSGGNISLSSNGTSAYTSIEMGGADGGLVDIAAQGNITVTASDGAGALLGALAYDNGGANVLVSSANGNVSIEADGDGSTVQIGNIESLTTGNLVGTVAVSAGNGIDVTTSGGTTNTARIGNIGASGGTTSGDIALVAANTVNVTGASQAMIGNTGGTASGNVTVVGGALKGLGDSIVADMPDGDFTLDQTGTGPLVLDTAMNYSSAHNLTIVSGGNIVVEASAQNAGSGDISMVAAGDLFIGGTGANGGVAVGSKSGTTTLSGDDIMLEADNGYAQVGYHGGGSGAILVNASGNVTLSGGAQKAYFAQIGDGGYQVSGSNSGSVTVLANGNVALNAGDGQEAYAQIGNGGAESNSNSTGYTDTGLITVKGEEVSLGAGAGTGSYAQIGNGGYKSGAGLNGKATVSGDIVVDAVSAILLKAGGTDAYAQIGNGGSYINSNAANGSSGSIFGNITAVVSEPQPVGDAVTMLAGTGTDSYVQIGNGGDFENTPASGATVSFTESGNITISDLTLKGGNSGINSYAQVGNGDAAGTGTGTVSGTITISTGTSRNLTNGTALDSPAFIGNGSDTSVNPPPPPPDQNPLSDPAVFGAVATVLQNSSLPTDSDFTIVTVTPEVVLPEDLAQVVAVTELGPLQQLADAQTSDAAEGLEPTDDLEQEVGDSLDGGSVSTETIIPGVLKEIVSDDPRRPRGVPPADEDYSSWGNEAFWRW